MDFGTLKKLYALGFALHWLRPKSKAPVKAGWTRLEKESAKSLKESYRKGMNVGVRLGKVSKVGPGFLAVIDLDVKSSDPVHRAEAEEKMRELFPVVWEKAPKVSSGRGGGSAHFYVLTPFPISANAHEAQSETTVRVNMISVEPSKKERETLTATELAEGVRLRKAWEISVLSEGRQVVLPGSRHPDTGALYVWERAISGLESLPLLEIAAGRPSSAPSPESKPQGAPTATGYQFTTIDPTTLGLRPEQLAALVSGEGVSDRSAMVFALCMALLQRRIPRADILSVFTDRSFFLGNVGFDHAKTTSRERAAAWVEKYCLEKANTKVNESLFSDDVIEENVEPSGELPPWMRNLDRTGGKFPQLRATFKNIAAILSNEVGLDLIRRNLFSFEDSWGVDTPWGCKEGEKLRAGREDSIEIKDWLITKWQLEAPLSLIEEVLIFFATQNEFHPVKEYIERLEWDGVERIGKAFKTYLGAEMPEPYLTSVTTKFFLALMKRVYEPGCKFDHIVVFEGKQGVGKSSFGEILVGKEWFMDGLPPLTDKDAALNLQGIWLIEMAELSALYRSQLETAKAFITRTVDKVRPPFGKRRVDVPRQNVFIGTTNKQDYLNDPTGARRFWPVFVRQVDFKRLERDREQLLAEAKFVYDFASEPLWLSGKTKLQAEMIQASRKADEASDLMQDALLDWLKENKRNSVTMSELFRAGPWTNLLPKTETIRSAATVLRAIGFKRVHSKSGWIWKRI